ncbi:hypothetical protein [Paenibacillus glacialis]|uniref:Uncharacterized protein n=1 Tax=Paenibacillus glacialis TaxID=494026 RepID=A0A168NP00_9BACL|nr:hypothetical protein [Paenibacillus glacialis]OAB45982.1 hypothetical protein PGLA_00875 [Paenibacillus glacialis]
MDQVLNIMTYTLNSGVKGTVPLSDKQIEEWIESYKSNTIFITVVGKEWFGLNSDLVADFKVHNSFSDHREYIVPAQSIEESNQLEVAYNQHSQQKTMIRVECKCGASYIESLAKYRTKSSCKECNSMVFLDKKVGLIDVGKDKGYYMTNKYYVEKEVTGL